MSPSACRACGGPVEPVLDLGDQPPAGLFPGPRDPAPALSRLVLGLCGSCNLVQAAGAGPDEVDDPLAPTPTTSATGAAHARALVAELTERGAAGAGTRILELASHGGHLAPFFGERGLRTTVLETGRSRATRLADAGVDVVLDEDLGRLDGRGDANGGPAGAWDLVVDHYLLAHLEAPRLALGRMARLLDEEGVLVLEFDDLLATVLGLQFDAVRHGHRSYLTLAWVTRELASHGLSVVRADPQAMYGGALRVWATRRRVPFADPAGVGARLAQEAAAGLDRPEGFSGLRDGVERMRRETRAWLTAAAAAGRPVAAYGAAARAVTFLNAMGIGPDLVPAVGDRAAAKQGRRIPGADIPIVAPDALPAIARGDVLILAWDLVREVAPSLAWVGERGAALVVALPELAVVGPAGLVPLRDARLESVRETP